MSACIRCGAGPVSCAHRVYEAPAMLGAEDQEKGEWSDWSGAMAERRKLSTPNHSARINSTARGRYR